MEIIELSHLVSLSMSYQAYIQELNAENVQSGITGRAPVLDVSFADLLAEIDVRETTNEQLRELLDSRTIEAQEAPSLERIAIAAEKSAASYRAVAESYGRILGLYRTSLGKG